MIRLHRIGGNWYNANNEKLEVLWKMPDGNVANITSACTVDTKGRVTLPDGLPVGAQVAVSYPVHLRRSSGQSVQIEGQPAPAPQPSILAMALGVSLYDPASPFALGLRQ